MNDFIIEVVYAYKEFEAAQPFYQNSFASFDAAKQELDRIEKEAPECIKYDSMEKGNDYIKFLKGCSSLTYSIVQTF